MVNQNCVEHLSGSAGKGGARIKTPRRSARRNAKMRHRILLSYEAETEEVTTGSIVDTVLSKVAVP